MKKNKCLYLIHCTRSIYLYLASRVSDSYSGNSQQGMISTGRILKEPENFSEKMKRGMSTLSILKEELYKKSKVLF